MKITKTLWLTALLCCAPASVVMTGCSGGSSSLPVTAIPGNYSGTFSVTGGPSTGETGPCSLTISSAGVITGSVTDEAGNTATFGGTANISNGSFTITGIFGETGTSGQAKGTIQVSGGTIASGSGTFSLSNGNSGTVTFSKIS